MSLTPGDHVGPYEVLALLGEGGVDARSGLFSFGSCCTRRRRGAGRSRPQRHLDFAGDPESRAGADESEIPREFEKIVQRCLRKDPARRFKHMGDVRIALEDLKEESDEVLIPNDSGWEESMIARVREFTVGFAGVWLSIFILGRTGGFAQSDNTQISGYVKDISGAIVPGAKMVVKNEGSALERSVETNGAGYYIITGLPPGFYEVTAERAGFKRHQTTHKKLDPNIAATEDIVLQIGERSETVNVEAAASAFQSDSAAIGKLIDSKQIRELQLNGRNPIFLALLKPGVNGPLMNVFSFDIRTNGSFSINGSRPRDNLVTYDGAVGIRTRSAWFVIGVADADAVQEVQVLTANYSAEYGRSSGGQIRIVTRSGTRDLRGSFYEFFRNSALDANSWQRNRTDAAGDRPCAQYPRDLQCRPDPFRYNQFGYNLSGPVRLPFMDYNKDRGKLFWLWAQEWVRYRQSTTASAAVPSLKMRQGDFSELLNPANRFFGGIRTVADPQTGRPFPGNIIPTSRLSPNGTGLLKAYPDPTPGYIGTGARNYYQEGPTWRNQRKDTFSVDWYPTARHSIRLRAQLYHYMTYVWNFSGTDRVPGGQNFPNQTTSINWTWTISPVVMNEFLATGSRDQVRVYLDTSNGKYKRGQYGIDYPYLFQEGKMIPDRIPTVSIPGVVTLSSSGQYPASSAGPIYDISNNITRIWGNHTLKAGILFERAGQNDNDQLGVQQNGTFSFIDTRPGGSGLALADAALGLFNTYEEAGARAYTPYRGHMLEWFVQDGWKITPKLRIELGLRHSIIQPYYSLWRNMVVFDPKSYDPKIAVVQDPRTGYILSGDLKARYNGLVFPGDGWPDSAKGRFSAADSGAYDFMFRGFPKEYSAIHKRDFQPRIGIAYAITPRTAIRAGVGRFFTRLGVRDIIYLGANPPLQSASAIYYGSADKPAVGAAPVFPLSVATQDPDLRNPESWVWNVTFERQLPFNTTLGIAYVGRRGLNGQSVLNINQLQPGTLQANPGVNVDYLRPYRGFGQILNGTNISGSRYNGLQLEASRRFTKDFAFGASYTWSKCWDLASDQYTLAPNSYDVGNLWGPCGFDRRHVMVLNGIYELPFLKTGKSWPSRLLGGWTVSFVSQFQTGAPFTITTADDFAGVGQNTGQPWVVNGAPNLSRGERKFSTSTSDANFWFKTRKDDGSAMFTAPPAGTINKQNVRNLLFGPGAQNHNISIFKNFAIKESRQVQFRFEAFNWVNHPNWNPPGLAPRSSGSFGKVQSKGSERNLQFALRYSF